MKRKTIRVRLVGGKMDGHEIICFDWLTNEIKRFQGESYIRLDDGMAVLVEEET